MHDIELLERGVERMLLPNPESDRFAIGVDLGVDDNVLGLGCFGVDGTFFLICSLVFAPGVPIAGVGFDNVGNLGTTADDLLEEKAGFIGILAGVSSNISSASPSI